MKVFFDTEFTGLHKDTTLISIGLVDENDRTFYAEFSDFNIFQCDEWIHENVIKHLKLGKYEHYGLNVNNTEVYGSKEFIKEKLSDWLSQYDEVELVSDCCHYDMVLFIDIFGGAFDIPANVNPVCHDINQDITKYFKISEREAFDISREGIIETYNEKISEHWPKEYIEIYGDKHNALYDAKVIKAIFKVINTEYEIK